MARDPDIRWQQRFHNYKRALAQLARFVEKGDLDEMQQQGLIQCFEYTYELAWNTFKELFEAEGEIGIMGSRDAFRLAFKRGLIEHGQTWMDMIKSRVSTTHTYDEALAEAVVKEIVTRYYSEFTRLEKVLEERSNRES